MKVKPINGKTGERYKERMVHYLQFLKVPKEIYEFKFIDGIILQIVEFERSEGWTYVTSGMSEKPQPEKGKDVRFELIAYTKNKSETILHLLLRIAEYPFIFMEPLGFWHTIPVKLSEWRFPDIYCGLMTVPPFKETEQFGFFKAGGKIGVILGVHALTEKELDFAIEQGGEVVGQKLIKLNSPWLDKPRESVIL